MSKEDFKKKKAKSGSINFSFFIFYHMQQIVNSQNRKMKELVHVEKGTGRN